MGKNPPPSYRNTKNYPHYTGQLITICARKTFLKMSFPWVLVNMLTEDSHHLSYPENISLGREGNIKVENSLQIYIGKKNEGI